MGIIYKITNTINGHAYIGQTRNSLKHRMKGHRVGMKKHSGLPLYRAFAKYGYENFTSEVIEECDNELLNEREMYWIGYYDTYNHGYNATVGGGGQSRNGVHVRENAYALWEKGYTLQDISKEVGIGTALVSDILYSKYGDIHEELKRRTSIKVAESVRRSVKQYDFFGNLIAEYSSTTDAGKAIGTSPSMISASCRNGYQAKGFVFKYSDDDSPITAKRTKKYPVAQYDLDGNLIKVYTDTYEASNKTGCNRESIKGCICGSQKTTGGYIWKKYNA